MSKKSKRMRAKIRVGAKPVPASVSTSKQATDIITEIKQPAFQNPKLSSAVQESQYRYIVPELVRISIIAGVFFIILIVLSFVIK